jgi:hypothetical protein
MKSLFIFPRARWTLKFNLDKPQDGLSGQEKNTEKKYIKSSGKIYILDSQLLTI